MNHVMFDVDGTLVESYDFDEQCFIAAVTEVIGEPINNNWSQYPHVTDSGLLNTILQKHDLLNNKSIITNKIKTLFIEKLKNYLNHQRVKPVKGALELVKYLVKNKDYQISIATGGWQESAILKLESAGFDISMIPFASADDHYDRSEIMRIAGSRANSPINSQLRYFSDAQWDQDTCKKLGVKFILVGNRIQHPQQIENLSSITATLDLIQSETID